MNIYGHSTFVGNTGYNGHAKSFFRSLNKYSNLKLRNYTVGPNWKGLGDGENCHGEDVTVGDKDFICVQTLWNQDGKLQDYPIFKKNISLFEHDVNLILSEVNHYYFYDNYLGPKIAYTVWEATKYPNSFFEKLKEFDQVWVPTKWQAELTVKQGIEAQKVKVVPEGVDGSIFFPETCEKKDKFTFLILGGWCNRKSTQETIRAFKNVFGSNEKVQLILSVDNKFNVDKLGSTRNRLKHYGLESPNIIPLDFLTREEYVKLLKTSHVFLSCSRSEGWNLPLIEAMASGIPSIYSNCSGQLEFAKNKGIPVNVKGEISCSAFFESSEMAQAYWYDPDYKDLERKIIDAYNNYEYYSEKAIKESLEIRNEYTWDNAAKLALGFMNSSFGWKENYKQASSKEIYHIINESSSLGDVIAWTPMVDKFQKEKNCEVNFYTPFADLFDQNYKNLKFLPYNQKPNHLKNTIRIGAFDVGGKKWNEFNLQELAAAQLGIKYEETIPKIIKPKSSKSNFSKKYVCIATQSTAQLKYWNNQEGWTKTVDYLKSIGYDVVCIDKHCYFGAQNHMNTIPNNCINKTGDRPLSDRINDILHCDFFIGLGSGLSWLAWACEKPVIMIAGFSKPNAEFSNKYRVQNFNVCNGCWNDSAFAFDKSNWSWCPKNKNFECSKEITFKMVKEKINLLISEKNLSLPK